jgi:hypothetical protein
MQCIYNYIPETNPVFKVNSVAAILYLQFMAHVTSSLMLRVLYFTLELSEALSSAQRGFFPEFLDFMLCRDVAEVFSE